MKIIRETYKKQEPSGRFKMHAIFRCDSCGCQVEKQIYNGLRDKSCGCTRFQHSTKHNCTDTKLFYVWEGMISRCNYKRHIAYKHYGGRGIFVCKKWNEFIPFKKWAQEKGYREGLEIDRRDNNKGYSPENCRFVTHAVNCQNMRSNKMNWVSVDAIRDLHNTGSYTYKKLSEIFGISATYASHLIKGKSWIWLIENNHINPKDLNGK